jgi:hypothetical protein
LVGVVGLSKIRWEFEKSWDDKAEGNINGKREWKWTDQKERIPSRKSHINSNEYIQHKSRK